MTEKRPISIGRRILRFKANVLLLLMMPMALVMSFVVCLHLGLNSATFAEILSDQLSGIFAGRLDIRELRIGLDPRHIEAYGAELIAPDGVEMVNVERFEADIKALSLLQGVIHVRNARASHARTLLAWDDRGNFNYTQFFYGGPSRADPPDEAPSSLVILIENVDVAKTDAILRFPDFELDYKEASIEDFTFKLEDGNINMWAGSMLVEKGEANFKARMFGEETLPSGEPLAETKGPLVVPLEKLRARGWVWFGDGFTIESISARTGETGVLVEKGLMDFRFDSGFAYGGTLTIDLEANARPVEYFAGPLLETPLKMSMSMEGFLGPEMGDNSHIHGKLGGNLDGITASGLTFEAGRFEAELLNRRLYITELELLGYGGSIALPEGISGPLNGKELAMAESPKLPDRAFMSLLDLTYRMPLFIENIQTDEIIADAVPGGLDPSAMIPATGALDVELVASGRLIDMTDRERFEPLPAFHRVEVESLTLARSERTASRPEAVIPTRNIRMSGQIMFSGDKLVSERDLVLRLDGDLVEIGDLDLDLEAQTVSARVNADIGDINTYLSRFGLEDFGGRASVAMTVDGPFLDPTITQGRLRIDEPVVVGYPGRLIETDFSLDGGWLSLRNTVAQGAFGNITASGRVQLHNGSFETPATNPRLDMRFNARDIELSALSDLLALDVPMSGEVTVKDGSVRGSALSPNIDAGIMADNLDIQGQKILRMEADFSVDPSHVEVQGLKVQLRKDRGNIEGDLKWDFEGEIGLKLKVTNVLLSDIDAVDKAGVGGWLEHMDIAISGADLALDELKATGPRGPDGQPTLLPTDISQWGTTRGLLINGGLTVRRLVAGQQRFGNIYSTWYTDPASREFTLGLISAPFIPDKARALIYDAAAGLDGDTVLKVREAYPDLIGLEVFMPQRVGPGESEIYADVRFSKLDLRGIAAGLMEGQIATEQQAQSEGYDIELRARTLAVERAARLAKREPPAIEPKRREQRATSTEQLLNTLGELVMSGELNAIINREDLSWRVDGEIEEIEVSAIGQDLSSRPCVKTVFYDTLSDDERSETQSCAALSYDGNLLQVRDLTLGDVTLWGQVTVGQDDPLVDLHLVGSLDMRLLNLMPSVYTELQGIAEVDLALKGRVSNPPQPSGVLKLGSRGRRDQVSFRLRALDQEVKINSGTIAVCPWLAGDLDEELREWCNGATGIQIPEDSPLRVELLDGKAQIHGSVPFDEDGVGVVSLDVETRGMSYRIPDMLDLTFRSDLELKLEDLGDPKTWTLGGAVTVIDGRFYQNINGLLSNVSNRFAKLGEGGRADAYAENPLDNPVLRAINLDLVVDVTDGFKVESEIETARIELDLQARLLLQQTLADLSLEGSVLTILPGGQIEYLGADFVIREGDLTWQGAVNNPRIKLSAEADIQERCSRAALDEEGESTSTETEALVYHVVLSIDGEIQGDYTVELSSRPFADEEDITTLIFTGCTTDTLDASSASRPGLDIVLQPLIGRVEEELSEALDIEDLQISPDEEGAEVRARKRLSQRFSISFDGAFKSTGSGGGLGLQIIIIDDLTLNFEFGQDIEDDEVKLDTNLRLRLTPFD